LARVKRGKRNKRRVVACSESSQGIGRETTEEEGANIRREPIDEKTESHRGLVDDLDESLLLEQQREKKRGRERTIPRVSEGEL